MELLRPLSDTDFAADSDTTSGTAVSLGPWNAGPQGVLVWCTQDAYIAVGEGVTATSASTPIPWRVSALQVSTSGTVYAKPINMR